MEGEWRAAEREGRAKQEVRDCELQSHAMSCKERVGAVRGCRSRPRGTPQCTGGPRLVTSLARAEMRSGSQGAASLLPWPGDDGFGSSQLLCLRTFLLKMREALSAGW